MEEAGKELGYSSKTETLDREDANTVEVSDYGVCDVSKTDANPNYGGSVTGDRSLKAGDCNMGNSDSDEKQVKDDVVGSVEVIVGSVTGEESDVVVETEDNVYKSVSYSHLERTDTLMVPETETTKSEVKSESGATHEIAGEEETVTSAGNEVINEKAKCEVEDNSDACGGEENLQSEKSQQSSVDNEKIEEDYNKIGVDCEDKKEEKVGLSYNEQGISGCETSDAKHSESAQVSEEPTQSSKGNTNEENLGAVSEVISAAEICLEEEITSVSHKEQNGEAMEIDYAAEGQVEKDVTVGDVLDNAGNESAGASMVQIQDVPTAEAERNDSSVVEEMEIDDWKDNVDMANDLTGTIESADSANPNSPTEDPAPGEVEPLDHNALFDPSSDIANFIDFSVVSSWSRNNNIQYHKTETGSVYLKEDKKPIDLAEEETLRSDENHKDEDYKDLDKKTVDRQGAMREEDDSTHEAPSIDPNQKVNTGMKENSDIKTNGVKRKADVLSEDSPGEGRKTVSLAKVSFAQRQSFKIGASIARAASQMAGSPSVLKGSYFGDETLTVERFVSQLHCPVADSVKETVISDIAPGFFLDYPNSSASQPVTPETVSNSNAVGTEAFEFEEMGDTYWTDRVIHNGGEEQMPPTEKVNYQVVPVELKPAQVQRTRRPYRRRQTQINIPHSASDKPVNFDENAPAELIMNFSETDTIPPEKSLCKMFRHFGPIRELQTEVDRENNRARVVFKKGADAEVAYNSAGRFNIFGTKAVNYELSNRITETFKVQPHAMFLSEEEATLCLPC